MIEGWVTAIETMPDLSAATAALVRRPPAGSTSAAPAACALPFARFREQDGLVRAWRRLEESASLPTQSHAFAAALADTMLSRSHIEIFYIAKGDDVAALLPLCREPGRFSRWTMVGAHQVCEPDDALYRNSESARLLAEALVRDGRPLEIDRLACGSALVPALRSALRGKGWMSVRPAIPTPTIELEPKWRDPASCFNSGRRSDFRRAARRAEEFGEVGFELLSPGPAEFDALFDEAVGVELRSWKAEAGTAIAADQAKESCFRHFFRSACEQGSFRIAFMRIDGRAVAMQMAIETLGRFWLFKIGFDESYERCSPGTLLMLHSIGWAARRGLAAYELLGNVEPWIAVFWTRQQHDCVWVRAYPFNAGGAFAFAADAVAALRRRLAPASA
ncbi:MAG TPA: GNAT family N-acetyltransferase [Allosphingosinicella sp.]|jgi:CelD/BcsL family acetyltransferase involved in cellulose biosynthesis